MGKSHVSTGSDKRKEKELELCKVFFSETVNLNLKVKVLTKDNADGILREYTEFCIVFDEGMVLGEKEGFLKGMELGRENGIEKGMILGEKNGELRRLISLYREGLLPLNKAVEKSGLSQEEFEKRVKD